MRAYSKEFLTGHGYAAYKRLSRRCKANMDKNYFEGLALAAKETYGFFPIETYRQEVSGSRAVVSYAYANANLDQSSEPWVKEAGAWKYDQC